MSPHRTLALTVALALPGSGASGQSGVPKGPQAPPRSASLIRTAPEEALHRLKMGNQRFAAGRPERKDTSEDLRRRLAWGQDPFAIVLTCADSRVPPEHVFNAGLGELFVVRVAGNVCEPAILASIEYAAEQLGVQLCVVMGHEKCDAVKAAAENGPGEQSPSMKQLLAHIAPSARRARRAAPGADWLPTAEAENAYATAADVMRGSKALQRLSGEGRFRVVAARYQLGTGKVEWLPERPWQTEPAEETEAARAASRAAANLPGFVALGRLRAGHRRFFYGSPSAADAGKERREAVAGTQKPYAVVVTCADARVSPEVVFDAGLGELCVVRVAGNVLTDENLASIEHAVGQLDVRLLVVMGHESCEAVKAAARAGNESELSASLRELLGRLEPSVAAARAEGLAGEAMLSRAVELNVLRFLAQVRSRSRLLRDLEREGGLQLSPCVYELQRGDLRWLKDSAGTGAGRKASPAAAPHR